MPKSASSWVVAGKFLDSPQLGAWADNAQMACTRAVYPVHAHNHGEQTAVGRVGIRRHGMTEFTSCAFFLSGAHEHNIARSDAFHPTRGLGVPRMFLTAHTRRPLLASTMAKVSRVGTHANASPLLGEPRCWRSPVRVLVAVCMSHCERASL